MKVAIIGLGYVGCTNAACISDGGHAIYGVDLDREKVAALHAGRAPFAEPEIDGLLQTAVAKGLIHASNSMTDVVRHVDVALVCVAAPNAADGSLDLSPVAACTEQLAKEIRERDPDLAPLVVAYRTTMAPGAVDATLLPLLETVVGEPAGRRFEVAFYPEFLREGTAVADYFQPPRIVLGEREPGASRMLNGLLDDLQKASGAPVFHVDYRTAELVKFTDNTWHALKVTFANEVARTALAHGADPAKAAEIFIADRDLNISPKYLRPGPAYGGSCLPKDVRAMSALASSANVDAPVIAHIVASNEEHKAFIAEHVAAACAGARRILQVGLSFKTDTDDLRESPHVDLWQALKSRGFEVRVYDPDVTPSKLTTAARSAIPPEGRGVLETLTDDLDAALAWADRTVVLKTVKSAQAKLALADAIDVRTLQSSLIRSRVAAE